jgi:segregation and condensation protein B
MFGTTPEFLMKMGLDSLSQLPSIADFVPGADVDEALEMGLRVDSAAEEVVSSVSESADSADGIRPSLGDLLDGDGSV